jgi:hypothetical protein
MLSAATALMCAQPSAASAQGFPLVCRGGPEMTIEARFEQIIGGQTGTIITVTFRPAAQAGSLSEPGPGECAWRDRPVNAAEPTTITMVAPNVGFSFDLDGTGRIKERDGGPMLILGGASVSERQGFGRVVMSILSGQPFTLQVTNNGRTFMVSSVLP